MHDLHIAQSIFSRLKEFALMIKRISINYSECAYLCQVDGLCL